MRFRLLVLVSLAIGAAAWAAEPADFTTTESGLKYAITRKGTGEQPQPGQVVVAHYTGHLPDGTIFDSSRTRTEPYAFTLGRKQVIPGWDEAFALLHVGDQATLVIPPTLAYGARQRGSIPPNSTLTFEVELMGIKAHALADALRETIDAQGLAAAQKQFGEFKAAGFPDHLVNEPQLNMLGYRYLQKNQLPEAMAILQWNAELFPKSANVYDSLGEAFIKQGDRSQAISNYAKSLELDPRNQNAVKMLAALKATPDTPDALAGMQAKMRLDDEIAAFDEAQTAGKPVSIVALRTKLDAFIARSPDSPDLPGVIRNYFYVIESADLKQASAEWRSFLGSTNAKVKELAESKMKLADLMENPMELTYTAVDGRMVDLASWRGKVVLIDFWATWCGPCLQELPNVKAAYKKFHDQGFEIAGISFEQAPDAAHPAKRQKTAEELKAFAIEREMPWPQYYDGLYWKNAFGVKYGIQAIPAMFLLDKEGRLVSTNARGAKLAQEVARLLAK